MSERLDKLNQLILETYDADEHDDVFDTLLAIRDLSQYALKQAEKAERYEDSLFEVAGILEGSNESDVVLEIANLLELNGIYKKLEDESE